MTKYQEDSIQYYTWVALFIIGFYCVIMTQGVFGMMIIGFWLSWTGCKLFFELKAR